ncbi:uncharacterized protein LOC126836379 isoform X2 [Adelges cooleyi]|uniref:uncharacterized protein LOC126836379 isoform X2 n=1 Tax=Adelges cooleyi TaxID=133065 RepID=UPI00218081E1|nr:uncharacterized protein LOC126836379 isoform X2 [Adelges cooleyi]
MKHFCVLITLVLVHVLAITENELKPHVYKTNCMLQNIEPGHRDDFVKTYIRSNIKISTLALMLTAPAYVYNNVIEQYPQEMVAYEQFIQNRIKKYAKLNLDVPILKFHYVTLSFMGATRRGLIEASLRRLLVEVESGPDYPKFEGKQTCCLIALFVTANDPTSRINDCSVGEFDGHGDCHLTDILGQVSMYRKFADGFWKTEKPEYGQIAKLT